MPSGPATPPPEERHAGEHGGPPATGAADDERARHDEAEVDEASDESFPASDPPAFTHSHAVPPDPENGGRS